MLDDLFDWCTSKYQSYTESTWFNLQIRKVKGSRKKQGRDKEEVYPGARLFLFGLQVGDLVWSVETRKNDLQTGKAGAISISLSKSST